MQSIKCSQCGLVNFADALACKRCNAPVADSQNQTFYQNNYVAPTHHRTVNESLWENAGFRKIIYGLLWIAGGSILTYYTNAIFYGAIIFGAVDVLRGVGGLFTETD